MYNYLYYKDSKSGSYMFGIIDAMRIPSHLSRAELLERPTTKGDSNGQN